MPGVAQIYIIFIVYPHWVLNPYFCSKYPALSVEFQKCKKKLADATPPPGVIMGSLNEIIPI